MKIDPYYHRQKDTPWPVDLCDEHIVHKFTAAVTPNLHFNFTIFFNVK